MKSVLFGRLLPMVFAVSVASGIANASSLEGTYVDNGVTARAELVSKGPICGLSGSFTGTLYLYWPNGATSEYRIDGGNQKGWCTGQFVRVDLCGPYQGACEFSWLGVYNRSTGSYEGKVSHFAAASSELSLHFR